MQFAKLETEVTDLEIPSTIYKMLIKTGNKHTALRFPCPKKLQPSIRLLFQLLSLKHTAPTNLFFVTVD